jgi:hypothetical protein
MEGDPQEELPDSPQAIAARHRQTWLMLGSVVGVLAVLVGLYMFFTRPAPLPGTGENLSAHQLAEAAKAWVGRLETIDASGKPRPVALAVTIGQGEMVTTCHTLPRGGDMHVVFFDAPSKAETLRLNREIDVCQLRVKSTGPTAAKLRGGDPAPGEKVYVTSIGDPANPTFVETSVGKSLSDASGTAFTLEAKEKFAVGAAVFDRQGRVAGIVNREGNVAWSASRIESARERQPRTN